MNLNKLIDTDYPDIEISERTRKRVMETSQSGRYSGLPVRLAMGMFLTKEEYEKYRKEVLSKPIP